jgi:DNA-directed RNA polymerase specialized sigma24 family protein
MSVELGGGSAKDQGIADAQRDDGQHVVASLYETFAAALYDYCVDLLDDAVTACDVVQDSLVAVDGRITALPGPGRLRVSLYAEGRRRCLRKLSGRAAAAPAPGDAPAPGPAPGPDDLDLALRGDGAPGADGETRSVVTAALARLDGRDREALSLAFRHKIAGPDLAEVLGISPYRARSLLHGAGVRFGHAAAVAAVLHAGPAGCRALLGLAARQEPGAGRPAARLDERLGRHLARCPDCARVLGGRPVGPELIGTVPLEPPVGRLGLRITRTARALGSYRIKVAPLPEAAEPPDRSGGPGAGGPPARGGRRRGVLKAVTASSAAIAVLAVLGVLGLRHLLISSPRPPAVNAVSGVQRSQAASPPTAPAFLPSAPGQRHPARRVPALPLVGPTPFGVLPTGSTAPSGSTHPSGSSPAPSRTSPAPANSQSPSPEKSPSPTTPPPTTPPPTTPPPTTPPPTPTPSSTTIG